MVVLSGPSRPPDFHALVRTIRAFPSRIHALTFALQDSVEHTDLTLRLRGREGRRPVADGQHHSNVSR